MHQDYSFWEYDAYHKTWDICIIGSGINGVSAGISILERDPDKSVLIVDRWFIPLGASTRNAGFSCFGSPSEILDDISVMGKEQAISLVIKRYQGLQLLQRRLMHSKACYETVGGYELFSEETFENVNAKLPYLNQLIESALGLPNVFNEIKVPDGIRGFERAMFNAHEGQLHPVYMMDHLKNKYLQLGGKLWTGLTIENIEEGDDQVVLQSSLALPVTAGKVIITTNAFVKDLIPELDVHGARNLVIVTEPIEDLKWKGCFHHDRGFYYFRNIGNRILLGGGRNKDFTTENTDSFGTNPIIAGALEEFLYRHLGLSVSRISHRWSGIIAVGNDKSPILRSLSPRVFVGVRCSGMGIALASVMGEELADMVLQQS